MPGAIENITDKILGDAKAKAELIIQEAKAKAERERSSIVGEAKQKQTQLQKEAKASAEQLRERLIEKNKIELRDKKLEAKQQALDMVFSKSLDRLDNMPADEFEKFLANFCKKTQATIKEGDTIALPEKYKDIDIKKIDPRLSLCVGGRSVSGGFVLVSGGIEQNNTFFALLDHLRYDMESKLAEVLF